MFPTGRCRVAIGAAAAAADDGCLGINLILRPGAHGWSRSKRKMVRCAGHGFDDVADEDDSGAPAQPRYSPRSRAHLEKGIGVTSAMALQ